MDQTEQREEAVFEAALRLPADQRAAYLDQTCGGDAGLRRRVEVLLGAFERAGGFMKQPAAPGRTARFHLPPTEKPGDKIGRYKLLQQIGEGGCGVVYMAEQEEPVRRRVALKVIKLGMDTKQVIARFEAERQALALMDHPNIAKVLEAGATETGRPYFVMELVRGIRITNFCDENNVSTADRLRLFLQVCQAIQHAHQKGVIHRDIKPSNILVTINDGVPVPKVIDFGIAKATQGRLTDQTLFTAFEQFIGTPAYMSPEQAVMTSLDIDTRSDIYSLGVLLYELLTGRTPFDAKELMAAGLDEMRRTILEQEPPKPSTRLGTMLDAERTATAKHQHTDAPKLIHLLRGDLDWIVMKSLDKDRARRYETANGLAADVWRHLNCEPVIARPPSRLYEFQKTVRRHKFGFAAAGAVGAALVLGMVGSALEAARAKRAERDQSRLRHEAEAEAAKSRQVSQFLKDMLAGVGPSVAQGRDTTLLREILERTAERISHLTNQPEAEVEVRNTLAAVYSELGQFEKAEMMYREALTISRGLGGANHSRATTSLRGLVWVLLNMDRLAEAETLARDVLGIRNGPLAAQGDETSDSLRVLAVVAAGRGRFAEAERLNRAALAMARESQDEKAEPAILNWLGVVIGGQGRLEEAEGFFRQALAASSNVYGARNPNVAYSLNNLADVLWRQHKSEEAEPLVREALAMRKTLYGYEHDLVPQSLGTLEAVLQGEGRTAEAESAVLQALEEARKYVTNNPAILELYLGEAANALAFGKKYAQAEVLKREALASARLSANDDPVRLENRLTGVAWVLREQGKYAEAESVAREALASARRFATNDPSRLEGRVVDVMAALFAQGKSPEADPLSREALACARRFASNDPARLEARLGDLGNALRGQRKYAEAEPVFREALASARLSATDDPARLENRLAGVAWVLRDQSKYAEAESLAREALASARRFATNDPARLEGRLIDVMAALFAQGKSAEAEPLSREALACAQRFATNDPARLEARLVDVGNALRGQGKHAEAEPLFREALASARLSATNDPLRVEFRLADVGAILRSQNKFAEAEAPCREALTIARRFATNDPAQLEWRLFDLGTVLRAQGKFAVAEPLLREVDLSGHQLNASDQALLEFTSVELGYVLQGQHKFAEAEPYLREALTTARQFATNDPSRLDIRLRDVGEILRSQGKYAEAEPFFGEAVASVRKFWSDDPARLQVRINDLADDLRRQGKLAEEESLRREELASKKKSGASNASIQETIQSLTDLLLAQHKAVEAEQLLRESPASRSEGGPPDAAFLRTRGAFLARRCRWKEAVADATKLIELDPADHALYHELAALLVQSGDLQGYRRNCAQELARFAGTRDANIAERMAKDCLILPDSGADLNAISAWADIAVAAGKDRADLPWFQFCKGLAEYRQGRFASAVDWMQKVVSHTSHVPEREAEAYMVMAMAQYRSKQADAASVALAKGIEIAETKLPKLDSGDLGGGWLDWIIAHALTREARALLEGQSSTPAEKKTEPR